MSLFLSAVETAQEALLVMMNLAILEAAAPMTPAIILVLVAPVALVITVALAWLRWSQRHR